MHPNIGEELTHTTATHELYGLVLSIQQGYAEWRGATTPQQAEELRAAQQQAIERLLALLQHDLERMARRWMYSQVASDVSSLALGMFAGLMIALPRLRLDPAKNVRGLLLQVAWRGVYDLHRRDRADSLRTAVAGTGDQQPDGASYDAELRIVEALDDQDCLQAVFRYWSDTLSPLDTQIVQARLSGLPFHDIAVQLGGVWTDAAVRQRYHRMIRRTREHLGLLGLFGEPVTDRAFLANNQ